MEKRVGDLLMEIEQLDSVASGTTLGEAVGLLGRQAAPGNPGFVLVVNDNPQGREILGTITLGDILSEVEPPTKAPDVEMPIFWQGQFKEQARKLFTREVDALMVPLEHALNKSSTLMEALHIMNTCRCDILVVMDGESVGGVLTREQLCQEIITAADE